MNHYPFITRWQSTVYIHTAPGVFKKASKEDLNSVVKLVKQEREEDRNIWSRIY